MSPSFKRSFFEEEEGFPLCGKVRLSGGPVPTEGGEEGGEEGPEHGQPGWEL